MNDVKSKRVNSFEEMKEPGNFMWIGDPPSRMSFVCPCGCGSFGGIGIAHPETCIWEWNKDLENPTTTPSIRFMNGCGWHVYLTNGVFTTC